jgi:hypothetical protein
VPKSKREREAEKDREARETRNLFFESLKMCQRVADIEKLVDAYIGPGPRQPSWLINADLFFGTREPPDDASYDELMAYIPAVKNLATSGSWTQETATEVVAKLEKSAKSRFYSKPNFPLY